MNDKISILIPSCEKYSDLWSNLVFLYDKYWEKHPELFLVSDKKHSFDEQKINFLDFDCDFSYRLKEALKHINTNYIFLSLDDYLPSKKIDSKSINYLIEYMEINGIDYCRIFKDPRFGKTIDKKRKIKKLSLKDSCYEINLYPALWKKESLLKIIEKEENPWQFEVKMTQRCLNNKMKCIACRNMKIFPFIDTIRKGKYLRHAYRFLKKEKLYISDRKVRTMRETFLLDLKTFIGRMIPMFIIRKYRASKFNKSFSSYANKE